MTKKSISCLNFCFEDGCGSKSTDTDLTGFYSYIFASSDVA
jgi:hypothetical protein